MHDFNDCEYHVCPEIQALNLELAARALAKCPKAQEDEAMQAAICMRYGIFFDYMTEDERQHLYNLANEFMGE